MTKKKNLSQQPSLIKKDIPKMPEGYYSSGPNPNLKTFVEQHATPYDPENDTYNVPPFDKPITTTKATAIYNMHTYWSKKPHDAIMQYIEHYTKPGDLVLDPFCGSGSTALAALMTGRKAIAIDLSPAATFITKNYCTPVDTDEMQRAFEELQAAVKPEMDWLYETRCDRCDGKAMTSYTVYSQVFQCPRCLQKIALFDCPEKQGQTTKGKPKKIRVCPHCLKNGAMEEIKASGKKYGAIPVMISYDCQEGCRPKRDQRLHNDQDPKKRQYFNMYDLGKIEQIESKEIPYWYPKSRMMNTPEDQKAWGLLWRRGIHQGVERVDQLFTKRNLWALALINNYCINSSHSDFLLFSFTGASLHCSKMATHKKTGGGYMMGTYYLPQISKERSVFNTFSRKFQENLKGIRSVNFKDELLISTQSATNINEIANNSIDYIFTDPPYVGKVQYGELNFVWESWMKFSTYWLDEEIIVNEIRGKDDLDWQNMMLRAMTECYRVLKPGHWISLCYHDTSEGSWQMVQDIMTEIGFIPEEIENILYIDTGGGTYNQLGSDKATKRDLVINFRKPRMEELTSQLSLDINEEPTTFREKAQKILSDTLQTNPGQTADRLYDHLVSFMVRKGEFERHNFDSLLKEVAEPSEDGTRWYLKDSTSITDEAETSKEESASQELELFMDTFLQNHPELEGVHYSDLFEAFLPIKDKPRRRLIDWLPEFFYKTSEGTWRPPLDEEERQQKTTLRQSGALRRVRRFVNAIKNSIPPSERDKPESPASLAEWIRQCRRAGLYEEGRLLYEKGGLSFDSLGDQTRLEVEEDYQLCLKRASKKSNESQPSRKKRGQVSLFEDESS